MRTINYIIWHTAGAGRNGLPVYQDVDVIRDYHINERGWSDIGYHGYVEEDGTFQPGRDLEIPGAHVANLNKESLGLCFAGHGDRAALTPGQLETGIEKTREWMNRFGVTIENVIGHREVDNLGLDDVSAKGKTCPGTLVDMDDMRARIASPDFESDVWPTFLYAPSSHNEDVEFLQKFLNEWGGNTSLVVDGYAGPKTSAAVKCAFGFYLHGDPRGKS